MEAGDIQTLAKRSNLLAKRTKTELGRSAVARVIKQGGKDFDPAKALEYLEASPALEKQMGTEAYQFMQSDLTRRVQSQVTRKAEADLLETANKEAINQGKQGIDAEKAKFLASSYGQFLQSMGRTTNPNKALDTLISNPQSVDVAVQLMKDSPEIKPVLARGMVDRLIEKSSDPSGSGAANVFNSADFSRRYATARPSLVKLVSPEELATLDSLSDSISKLSQRIAFRGTSGTHPAISERLPGGLYLRGLMPNVVEAITGKPANELAIRPVHIMKISRDLRLADLFGQVASNPSSAKGRIAAFSLAYGLSRIMDSGESEKFGSSPPPARPLGENQ